MSNPSVFDKSNLTRVVIAAAAVAVPLATLAFLRSRGKKPVRVPVVDQMPSSPAQWTTAHVISWLRTLQVSADALKAFEEGEVDGSVLLMLQEAHLRDMGVRRVGDVIKIATALQALRGESSAPASREVAPDSVQSAESQDDKTTAEQLAQECRERLKGVHTFLGSEKLAQAPPRAQIAALNQVEVELHQVLRAISALPPSNSRQELLKNAFETEQLAVRLRETITAQESGSSQQGAPAAVGAPAASSGSPDWERVIKAVTDSLQNLHSIIMSEEAAAAPLAQRKEVFAVVSSQLDKIRQVVAQLPNEVRDSVSKACDSVQRQATARLLREEAQPTATPRDAQAQTAQPAQPQRGMQTSDALIGELRKIFVDLQSADLISEPSETKQATTLASLLHRIDEVKTIAASQLRGEERVLVLEMCAKIQEAVQQTGATCAKKNEIARSQGHGHSHEQHSHDHSHGEHHHHHHHHHQTQSAEDKKVSFVEIMQGLNDITTALKSEAFSKLTPEVRRATLEKMWNRLIALEPAVHALSDSDRSDVAPIFSKLKQYFSFALSGESAPATAPRTAAAPASAPTAAATQASDDNASSLELRRAQAEKVQSILGLLQAMYSLFNSKEFLQAPPQQQQNFLTSASAQLRQLEGAVQSLGQDDKTAIMPLFTGISDYVVALKNAIEADLASPTNAPPKASVSPSKTASAGTNTQAENAAAKAKSPGILSPRVENATSAAEVQQTILNVMEEVTGSLNDMLLLIRSDDAKTASREQREGLVRAVYDQVIRIASFADKLPEEERATLKSLCAQVLEESQGLLSIKSKRGQAAQADGDEPVGKSPSPAREGTSPAQRRRQQEEKEVAEAESAVLQTLQSISNLLASEDFRRQNPETRVKISMSLAKRLEAMDPVIRSLPEADRQVLAHQVHLIRSVLAAVNGDATEEVDQEEEARAEAEAQAEAEEGEEHEEEEQEEGEEEEEQGEAADQRSAPTEQDRATQMAAASIASRLQQLYAVVSSKQFEDSAPPEQLQLLTAVERQLGPLERDISMLKDSPHRNSLSEVLGNLRQILAVYRRPLRGAQGTDVFRRAAEATATMESGEVKTLGQIKAMMELLEEIDQVPTKTELQLKIRKAFQQALSRTIDSVSANVSEGNVDEEDEEGAEAEEEEQDEEETDGDEVVHLPSPGSYNAPPTQTASRNARATEERDEKADLDESDFGDLDQGTRAFVRAVLGIRSMLRGPEAVSTADASKTAGALQAVLQNAKTKNIAWQQNSAVVELVRSVLEDLESARENASDEAAQGTVQMLNEAAAQLRQSEPGLKSVTDLAPWLSLLDTVNEMQSELGVEELQALQGFQQEILRASRNIRERMDLQPSARNPTVSPRKNQAETSPARSPRPPQ